MSEFDGSLRVLTGYRMHRATVATSSRLSKVFARYGLRRTTFSALALVVDKPGLRQGQLAEALAIERPHFVQIVDELEDAGLILRKRAVDDRRAYAIAPTPKGTKTFKQAMTAVEAFDAEICRDLTPEQRDALHQALDTIETTATFSETLKNV